MTYKLKYLLILILTCSFTLGIRNTSEASMITKDIIHKKIYIEDIDISNCTIDEAIKKVSKKYTPNSIKLTYEDKVFNFNPSDIDLNYNVDKAIKEAYNYTRTDSTFENIKRKLSLDFDKDYHRIDLVATYNEAKLSEVITNICNQIDVDEVNATIVIEDSGAIKTTPSSEGKEVEVSKLKEEIYTMITDKKLSDIQIPVKISIPEILTEDVTAIDTVLGQFTTTFSDNNSRGSNIHVAAEHTSNKLIMPFKEFSYNNSTGARTWHNGYKTAKVIVGGKYVNGEGGGVCQVSTTIYNAALLAAMEITEVHNHTFVSHYVPAGRDATVSYGYTDFKFKNPLRHPVYIKNITNNGVITSKIYGCSQDRERLYITTKAKYDKDKLIVDTHRIYLDEEGNTIRDELVNKSTYTRK